MMIKQAWPMRPLVVALAVLMLAWPARANPYILFELGTGRVIEHRDAFQRWHPASLTKLMTAYVTFRAIAAGELALDSPIRVTKHAAAEPPSKMGYKPGSVMTLDNALKMMIVKSANDIAMAIGENVAGSEKAFVERMNAEAARLGMTRTHFVNPNGLHAPDQYTTARDMAVLASALRTEFPQYADYFAIQGLKAGKKRLMSYNMLIGRYEGADGMKTGFVCPSGFNMVGSATRGGRTLVAVVLGGESALARTDLAAALLNLGFTGRQGTGETLSSLKPYGLADAPPMDMREQVCNRKKPAAAQSEAAGEVEAKQVKSPWLAKIENARLVEVKLGGAKGPVPLAMRNVADDRFADVPIPTPRPDYPATTLSEQGDSGTR